MNYLELRTARSRQCRESIEQAQHPLRVAAIVDDVFFGDSHMVAVALLHDVIEKQKASIAGLERRMGRAVAGDVTLLTRPFLGPEASRERMYFDGLICAPERVLLVKAADYLDDICNAPQGMDNSIITDSASRFVALIRPRAVDERLTRALAFLDAALTGSQQPEKVAA